MYRDSETRDASHLVIRAVEASGFLERRATDGGASGLLGHPRPSCRRIRNSSQQPDPATLQDGDCRLQRQPRVLFATFDAAPHTASASQPPFMDGPANSLAALWTPQGGSRSLLAPFFRDWPSPSCLGGPLRRPGPSTRRQTRPHTSCPLRMWFREDAALALATRLKKSLTRFPIPPSPVPPRT